MATITMAIFTMATVALVTVTMATVALVTVCVYCVMCSWRARVDRRGCFTVATRPARSESTKYSTSSRSTYLLS